jgi:hypothetical protein
MKIRPVGAELFHAYRQTDMAKLIVAFRNFSNASKQSIVSTTQSKPIDPHTRNAEAVC